MRDDEDNIRQYLPVLRRIIILVAVLTAIPVVMWTATAFVRSHISAPRPPALQPMAIAPSSAPADTTVVAASDQPPTQSANTAQATQPKVSAYADRSCPCRCDPDGRHTDLQNGFRWGAVKCGAGRCHAPGRGFGRCRRASRGRRGAEPSTGRWHADRGPAAGLSVASAAGGRSRRIAAGRSDLRTGAAAAQAPYQFRDGGKCAVAGTAARSFGRWHNRIDADRDRLAQEGLPLIGAVSAARQPRRYGSRVSLDPLSGCSNAFANSHSSAAPLSISTGW